MNNEIVYKSKTVDWIKGSTTTALEKRLKEVDLILKIIEVEKDFIIDVICERDRNGANNEPLHK